MNQLMTCPGCGGFQTSDAAVCPHCDAPPSPGRRRRWSVLLGLAGSASLGLTMMACYGAPPTCNPEFDDCGGNQPDANGSTTDGGPDGGADPN